MPTKRRTSAKRGGKRDHGRQRTALQSRTTGRRNNAARRPQPAGDRADLPAHTRVVAGVAIAAGPRGVGGAGALQQAGGRDPRAQLIVAACTSATLMIVRLHRCAVATGGGIDCEDLALDDRISAGDSTASYDVIGSCMEDLDALRDRLGELMGGAAAMARVDRLRKGTRCSS